MKVLLVQPRVCAEAAYPLGLASLIPTLKEKGHEVVGLDLSFHSFQRVLEEARESDAVGITLMSHTLPQARSLVEGLGGTVGHCRTPGAQSDIPVADRRSPGTPPRIPVVLGGPHPTLFPDSALEEAGASVAVVGEGETCFSEVLDALANEQQPLIPGVVWPGGASEPRSMPSAPAGLAPQPIPDHDAYPFADLDAYPFADLDAYPFADREVFPIHRYSRAMRSVAMPYTTMVTSRGCRRACAFCPSPRLHPRGYRARSPEHVYEEMATLERQHGVRDVHFEDDDLLGDRDRFERLCDLLARRPLKLVWESVNGIAPERLEPGLFPLMARAGCRSLVLSIEMLSEHAPDSTRGYRFEQLAASPASATGCRFEQLEKLIRSAKSSGIVVGGYFMVGLPGYGLAENLESIRSSYRLGLSRANYTPFQRVPGSLYWVEQDRCPSKILSPARAKRLALAAQVGFYLHPKPLAELVDEVRRHPEVLPSLLARVKEQLAGGVQGLVVGRTRV